MNKELKYPNRPAPEYTRLQLVWLALQLGAENIGDRPSSHFHGLERVAAHHDVNGNSTFALYRDRSGKTYYAEGNLCHLPW